MQACDPHDHTPLFWACKGGHVEIVELLLDRGVYIDAKDKRVSSLLVSYR
jgi:ankyrin repeat protein